MPGSGLLRDYYSTFDNEETVEANREWVQADFEKTLDALEHRRPKKGRLVDIGSGTGAFLVSAAARGWSVTGIDPSQRAVERARCKFGFEVLVGSAEDPRLPRSSFDVVHASHVLEHVRDPVSLVQSLGTLLTPGGLLVMLTPNAKGLLALIRRERFNYWIPPTHLTGFTPKSAARLLAEACLKPAGIRSRGMEFDLSMFLRNRTSLTPRRIRSVTRILDRASTALAPLSGSILELWATTPTGSA